MNFIQDFLDGKIKELKEIEDYTELWHEGGIEGDLSDAWGMSEEEYFELIASSDFYNTLQGIINRKSQNRVASALRRMKVIINKFK